MAKKSTPMMFRDQPVEEKFKTAKSISDLKNLGPMTEKTFLKAGIKTVQQFKKLGWKKSMEKIAKIDPKNRHPLFAYAMIGALTNTDWNRIPDQDKLEARQFCAALKPKPRRKS